MASRNYSKLRFVTAVMDREEHRYWRAFHSDGKTMMYAQLKTVTVPESVRLLENLAKDNTGLLVLKLYKTATPPGEEGKINQHTAYEFTIDLDDENGSNSNRSNNNGMMGNDASMLAMYLAQVEKNNKLELEKLRLEFEFKEKLAATSTSEDAKGSMMKNSILNRLLDRLDGKTSSAAPVKQIAGTSSDTSTNLESEKAKFLANLKKLGSDDKDFPSKIAKLAKLKEEDPATYKTIIDTFNSL